MTDLTLKNQRLAKRYDMAAASWHNKISNFGFLTPYPMLAQVGLLRAGDNVIDIGTGCRDFAQEYLAVHTPTEFAFHRGTMEPLHARQKYNVALCAHMIEHCPAPQTALTEIFDRLEPGDTLLLAASKRQRCTALIRLIWRSKAFSPQKGTSMLAIAGFDNINDRTWR